MTGLTWTGISVAAALTTVTAVLIRQRRRKHRRAVAADIALLRQQPAAGQPAPTPEFRQLLDSHPELRDLTQDGP